MADLLALEKLCNVLPDQITKSVNRLTCRVVEVIDESLVQHTPVDVTTAVSNWQASLNAPVVFELPAIYPGERGSTATESREEALLHVKRTLADKKPGEATYLSNLAPYILDLNTGTSQQEPGGFVERAIAHGKAFAASAKLEAFA